MFSTKKGFLPRCWVLCVVAVVAMLSGSIPKVHAVRIVVHDNAPLALAIGGDDRCRGRQQQQRRQGKKRDTQGGGGGKSGEQWCNQYFCLTATVPSAYTTSDSRSGSGSGSGSAARALETLTTEANETTTTTTTTEITYSLVARSAEEEGVPGWLAVGVGHQMMGGKMWIVWWPSSDGGGEGGGGCVLNERDGTGHKPPTITAEPIARLLPNARTSTITQGSNNTVTTTPLQPFECTWSVPVEKLPYFEGGWPGVVARGATPMAMMWAYSDVPPVPVQGGSTQDEAGAGIKMHDAFGTFGIDLGKQFVGEDEGEDAGGAGAGASGEKDVLKGKRRKMVIRAHAVVMTIAWIVTAPIAVLFARYGRGAFKWVPYHQYLQIGATAPLALVGFFLAVSAVVMRGGKSFQGAHEILGLLLFLLLLLQVSSGLWIHYLYNPDRTHRPSRNYFHMTAGLTLLVGGFVDVQLGIRKWGSPRWMVVSYWVWTGLLIATFVLGYTLLPRQLRQEKEAAKQRNPTTRLSRIQASFPDRDNKSKISPFPSANSPSPGVGSASKSKIKYPWHARRVGAGDMMGDIPMLEYNDRMNGLSVPPPSGGINRDETEGRDGNFGQRGRHGMWRAA